MNTMTKEAREERREYWRKVRHEEREEFRKNWKAIVSRTVCDLGTNVFFGAFMGVLASALMMKLFFLPYLVEVSKACAR